jgi:flagellin
LASIMTNASALTALQSLSATNKSLEQTQARISTGYRVSQASDNAAYWSIATTMRSDNAALSTVQDALGLGASKVDTAYTGMNNVLTTIGQIKTKVLVHGRPDGCRQGKNPDRDQGASDADEVVCRCGHLLRLEFPCGDLQAGRAANDGVQPDSQIVSSFNRSSSGAISIGTINIDVEGTKLFDYGLATGVKNYGTLDRQTSIYATGPPRPCMTPPMRP